MRHVFEIKVVRKVTQHLSRNLEYILQQEYFKKKEQEQPLLSLKNNNNKETSKATAEHKRRRIVGNKSKKYTGTKLYMASQVMVKIMVFIRRAIGSHYRVLFEGAASSHFLKRSPWLLC